MRKLYPLIIGILLGVSNLFAQSGLDEAEDFLVKDVFGTNHTLNSYLEEGKIVVLPFFTTTCGSCNIYTPEIVESFQDFGCNQNDVFYLGINWGANNIGVIDFMAVHAVGYPCASGIEGLGNDVNEQYEIASHITALVIQPDGTIAGQFFGPNAYPTRDSLNNLLLSLGAEMQPCGVGIQDILPANANVFPNPASNFANISFNTKIYGSIQVSIFNITGKLQKQYNFHLKENDQITLEISDLPIGIYFIEVKDNDNLVFNQKLIKK